MAMSIIVVASRHVKLVIKCAILDPTYRRGNCSQGEAPALLGKCEQLRAAHFLIRLLFCLFAEDIGLRKADFVTRQP